MTVPIIDTLAYKLYSVSGDKMASQVNHKFQLIFRTTHLQELKIFQSLEDAFRDAPDTNIS